MSWRPPVIPAAAASWRAPRPTSGRRSTRPDSRCHSSTPLVDRSSPCSSRRSRSTHTSTSAAGSSPDPSLTASFFRDLRERAVEIHVEDHLRARIERGDKLRVKLGLDPTAPDIHVGHLVVLDILRAFQDHGHTVVLIVGDFTAMIGDPSGRSETRPILTREQVDANAKTYFDQIF